MKITNSTKAYEVAELMGPDADNTDGQFALDIMLEEGISDTDNCDFFEVCAQANFRKQISTPV